LDKPLNLLGLKVLPENVEAFLQAGIKVDKFASTIKVYVGAAKKQLEITK
jgi:hypothetical protein